MKFVSTKARTYVVFVIILSYFLKA